MLNQLEKSISLHFIHGKVRTFEKYNIFQTLLFVVPVRCSTGTLIYMIRCYLKTFV